MTYQQACIPSNAPYHIYEVHQHKAQPGRNVKWSQVCRDDAGEVQLCGEPAVAGDHG